MKHYNPTLSEDTARTLNLKGEFLDEIEENIQPVVVVNRITNISRSATRTTNGTSTLFASPANKDFYIVSAVLSMECDDAMTGTQFEISATIDGQAQYILAIAKLANGIKEYRDISITFNPAIKIDHSTNVNLASVFAAGNATTRAIIYGYTVETVKGI